ncbi:hypothetical protein F5Y17DRAFT_457673 [Xylariaceae sp. FL0594]|nr:hypothetical protein F5Y17DRAFT_457673 [Xylariaceae sp. FL0594]
MAWRNEVNPEHRMRKKGETPWCLAFKARTHGPDGEWVLRLQQFAPNPWNLRPRENMRQALGKWWQWPLFWIQPERVSRYGNYAGWDLPFSNQVLRTRDGYISTTSGTIERPTPAATRAAGQARRRHDRSSNISRRSQHRSSGGSMAHMEAAV